MKISLVFIIMISRRKIKFFVCVSHPHLSQIITFFLCSRELTLFLISKSESQSNGQMASDAVVGIVSRIEEKVSAVCEARG